MKTDEALLGWLVSALLLGAANNYGCSVSNQVKAVSSPPSVKRGARENNFEIIIFPEVQNFALTTDLVVDGGTITKGTVVDVYFLHADPEGFSQDRADVVTFRGSVTFDADILGVIGDSKLLDTSDSLLGLETTRYPNFARLRGMEGGRDWLSVSSDSRTLNLFMAVAGGTDQIRVIVKAK